MALLKQSPTQPMDGHACLLAASANRGRGVLAAACENALHSVAATISLPFRFFAWPSTLAPHGLLFEHRPGPVSEIMCHRARGSRGQNTELRRKSMNDNKATRLSRLVGEMTEAAKRLGLEARRERIFARSRLSRARRGVPVARKVHDHNRTRIRLPSRSRCSSRPYVTATWSSYTYRKGAAHPAAGPEQT
jgi:hypothetical protein